MSEPLQTQPERSETGTLVDQSPKPTETKPSGSEISEPPKAEAKPAEGEKSLLNEDDKPVGAPEKYDFKLPEGYELDPGVSKEASDLFKKHGLPAEAAQELVDFYIKQASASASAPFEAYKAQRQEWRNEIKSDATLANIGDVKTTISRALTSLGDAKLVSEFKAAMDLTGSGDHPAFVKVLFKLSQKLVEGSHISGAGPSEHGQKPNGQAGKPSAAQALYPGLPSNR